MKNLTYKNARLPYGTWGCSYFPYWQTSPLAEVNIGQFAAEAMVRILGQKFSTVDYLISGSTIPWHWKFWNSTTLSSLAGKRIPGFHLEQACATGMQSIFSAANEVEIGTKNVVATLTFDRTSDSPVGVFPERRAHQRTIPISDVWDNFGFDPATGKSMISSAGFTARLYKLEKKEVDDIAFHRYQTYFSSKERGFFKKFCKKLEILNLQGNKVGIIEDDIGVRNMPLQAFYSARELDTCVTSLTQTHASDGMATLLVTNEKIAKELSTRPEISISIIAKEEVRTKPNQMPEAPALASLKLLDKLALNINDISVIKTHNPFAVNDAIFSKLLNIDFTRMNKTGCSLVWGHPQAPTLTRLVLEGIEEAVEIGGGYVLIAGCAAGDVGIAGIFKVD